MDCAYALSILVILLSLAVSIYGLFNIYCYYDEKRRRQRDKENIRIMIELREQEKEMKRAYEEYEKRNPIKYQ